MLCNVNLFDVDDRREATRDRRIWMGEQPLVLLLQHRFQFGQKFARSSIVFVLQNDVTEQIDVIEKPFDRRKESIDTDDLETVDWNHCRDGRETSVCQPTDRLLFMFEEKESNEIFQRGIGDHRGELHDDGVDGQIIAAFEIAGTNERIEMALISRWRMKGTNGSMIMINWMRKWRIDGSFLQNSFANCSNVAA